MTENAVAFDDPSFIFEDLILSSAFEPRSATIEEKRRIFGKVWGREVARLRNDFDFSGMDKERDDHGFGFLVEAFARCSGKLPPGNTEKGERAAREIISELHSGKRGNIRLGSRQSNSDFVWVKLTGRRIVVTGIGEIKASYRTAKERAGGQLRRQETSLGYLAEELETAKLSDVVKGYFRKRGIKVADNLAKFLIVPFGEGESVRRDEGFSGWQVVELEFSYDEIVFVAQRIWPYFRPDQKFFPGKLANLFCIANNLAEWVRPRLDNIFSDSEIFRSANYLPYFELGLFYLATGKTPLMEDEAELSADLVRRSFWPAVQRYLDMGPGSIRNQEADFSGIERNIFNRFLYVLTEKKEDMDDFIYFLRLLKYEIDGFARREHRTRLLSKMSKVWTV